MAGVIDADTHIIESEDVWQFFDPDLRQKKPALVAFPDPDNGTVSHRWIIDGDVVPKPNGRGGVFLHTPPMSEQEAVELDWACRSLTDPATRVAHMQRMGVEMQIVYPTMFITFLTHDVKLEIAMCASFARFMADVWAQSENRLRWIVPLPLRSIDASIEAMHFAKDNGAVGVLFRGIEEELSLAEPYFDPIYAEAERLNLPICIHTGSGSPTFTEMCNSRYMGNFAHIRLLPLIAFHDLVANKVPERYPNLRFGFIEAAASWVPFLLHFLNRRNRVNKGQLGPIMLRSFGPALFRDYHIYVACEADEDIPYLLNYIGEDNLLIGSDYGHHDQSAEPDLVSVLRSREDLPSGLADKILTENPRRFYALA